MQMRGMEIRCKLSLLIKSPGSDRQSCKDMQNCFVYLLVRKMFSPPLTATTKNNKPTNQKSRKQPRAARVRANTFLILLGAAWHDSSLVSHYPGGSSEHNSQYTLRTGRGPGEAASPCCYARALQSPTVFAVHSAQR